MGHVGDLGDLGDPGVNQTRPGGSRHDVHNAGGQSEF